MPELLVAMLVLLVGIWVVAAKFPKLTEIMRGERLKDQMARMAEQQMENARDGGEWLPAQVAAYDPGLAGPANLYGLAEALSPVYTRGDEPDWDDQARPVNPVENTLLVLGETFRVPAPGPDAPDPQAPYFLKAGPAALVWWVYQPIPLTRDDDIDPGTTVTPQAGTFYTETAGTLRFVPPERDPQGNPFSPAVLPVLGGAVAEVSYAWVDNTGREHWLQGESVLCQPSGALNGLWTSSVLSGVTAGGGIVPGSVTAFLRSPYDVQNYMGTPVPTANPPIAALDQRYGHVLWFNASEQGKTLCVGYRLRTYANPADPTDPDIGRRIPLIIERHRVPDQPSDPTAGVYEVALDHRKLEDAVPLFSVDLGGAPLTAPYDQTHVFAVDAESGDIYTDADGTLTVDYPAEGEVVPGWDEGRISFPAASPAAGRDLVFYYRTIARETVQLQRAPSSFTEDIWSGQTTVQPVPGWAIGRWYFPSRDGTTYDPTSPTLKLPDCCLSQTVRVEYVGRGNQRLVEVHTLGTQSPATVTVDDPDVSGAQPEARIISVSGVSLRAFATWLDRGRLRTTSVEGLLAAQLEPTLAKESRETVSQP
jgi:hypothetical protein